tara:strand:+ start:282 stop:650 length:369 start_codon:yes stop_codon:yes gene_type:complete
MAHFAQLDDDNNVINVLVVGNDDCLDENGNESEAVGIAFLQEGLGSETKWKQTSYNNNFRVRYACIGGYYDSERNAFMHPKPFPSWTLNEETLDWQAPVDYPPEYDLKPHTWDEENQQWVEL